MKAVLITFLVIVSAAGLLFAQEQGDIKLPPPQTDIGQPIMRALKNRASFRDFKSEPLPQQEISNILWAGFGINRKEIDGRTAPSSKNLQEIDIYVFLSSGVYIYRARGHKLEKIFNEDLRKMTGKQDFVELAPMNLVFVSDQARMENKTPEEKNLVSGAHAGSIYQNINLYCSSQNLGVVVRAMMDRQALTEKLKLKPTQKIVVAQTIGYKK